MTPPAEGERAREAPCCSECGALAEEGWPTLCLRHWNVRLLDEIQRTIAERDRAYADCAALHSRLRAPQPRGLTGDVVRAAEALADYVMPLRDYQTVIALDKDAYQRLVDALTALRALNLSAIEGAPAAGEREAVDALRDAVGNAALMSERVGGRVQLPASLWGDVIRAAVKVAPASPRSAAPASWWFSPGEWTYNGQPVSAEDMNAVVRHALERAAPEDK